MVICPKAVPFMRYDCKHLTTTLVDDMDSKAPTKMPCVHQQSEQHVTTLDIAHGHNTHEGRTP
jgi:hypothetical protein